MIIDENIIIKKCQNGDLTRFAEIYDFYINKIYNFIYYRTGHKEIAEDITSTVFLKAIKKINSFTVGSGTFSSWLYCIARNTVIDHYRTNKNGTDVNDLWSLGKEDNFIANIDNVFKIEEIREYLKNFSVPQREIIIMRIWDGLSYKEIAEITGRSEGSIKMNISRALKSIRKKTTLSAIIILFFLN